MRRMQPLRRTLLASALAGGLDRALGGFLSGTVTVAITGTLAFPALASSRRALRQMTDGPFYPPARWRAQWSDWDADLTRVAQGGETHVARGEHLGLALAVVDTNGRLVDSAEVEIWQCDSMQH
jgi:protocatechuate 3,4-dioxygenase, beta subunit